MANTFIPGYLAEVKIGANQVEANLASGTLTLSKNIMSKPVAGDQEPSALAGLMSGSISVSGHISTQDVAKFNTAFESNAVVAFIWGVGDTDGSPDAGEYTGNMLVESFACAFDADDSWSFSMDCVISGAATYVAPV